MDRVGSGRVGSDRDAGTNRGTYRSTDLEHEPRRKHPELSAEATRGSTANPTAGPTPSPPGARMAKEAAWCRERELRVTE